nr:hypothetical protein [Allobaculum sp. Allo2]
MTNIDQQSVNAIRILAADAIQKANSGHPGAPLGTAPMMYELFAKHLSHNPETPNGKIATVLFFPADTAQPACTPCFISSAMESPQKISAISVSLTR